MRATLTMSFLQHSIVAYLRVCWCNMATRWSPENHTHVPMPAVLPCVGVRTSTDMQPEHVHWEMLASIGNNVVSSQDNTMLRRRADDKDVAGGSRHRR